jgi:hypothetical protein
MARQFQSACKVFLFPGKILHDLARSRMALAFVNFSLALPAHDFDETLQFLSNLGQGR